MASGRFAGDKEQIALAIGAWDNSRPYFQSPARATLRRFERAGSAQDWWALIDGQDR